MIWLDLPFLTHAVTRLRLLSPSKHLSLTSNDIETQKTCYILKCIVALVCTPLFLFVMNSKICSKAKTSVHPFKKQHTQHNTNTNKSSSSSQDRRHSTHKQQAQTHPSTSQMLQAQNAQQENLPRSHNDTRTICASRNANASSFSSLRLTSRRHSHPSSHAVDSSTQEQPPTGSQGPIDTQKDPNGADPTRARPTLQARRVQPFSHN